MRAKTKNQFFRVGNRGRAECVALLGYLTQPHSRKGILQKRSRNGSASRPENNAFLAIFTTSCIKSHGKSRLRSWMPKTLKLRNSKRSKFRLHWNLSVHSQRQRLCTERGRSQKACRKWEIERATESRNASSFPMSALRKFLESPGECSTS